MTPEDVAAEIAERRRALERKLRRSIYKALKFRFGANATEAARKCLTGAARAQFDRVGIEHAFAPDFIVLNLSDLFNIIQQNWEVCSAVVLCKPEDFDIIPTEYWICERENPAASKIFSLDSIFL